MVSFKDWTADLDRRAALAEQSEARMFPLAMIPRAFVEADQAVEHFGVISSQETAQALVTQAIDNARPGTPLDPRGFPILSDRRPPRGATRMWYSKYQRYDGIEWVTDEFMTAQLNNQGNAQALEADEARRLREGD